MYQVQLYKNCFNIIIIIKCSIGIGTINPAALLIASAARTLLQGVERERERESAPGAARPLLHGVLQARVLRRRAGPLVPSQAPACCGHRRRQSAAILRLWPMVYGLAARAAILRLWPMVYPSSMVYGLWSMA